jgi:hypothetical protein
MNRLLIAFALLFVAAVCQAQVETGTIDCGNSGNWLQVSDLPNRVNVRQQSVDVDFSSQYRWAPKVYVSFSELDIERDTNVRVTTNVDSVSTTGFRVSCVTWADSIVFSVKLHWISVYDRDSCYLAP